MVRFYGSWPHRLAGGSGAISKASGTIFGPQSFQGFLERHTASGRGREARARAAAAAAAAARAGCAAGSVYVTAVACCTTAARGCEREGRG